MKKPLEVEEKNFSPDADILRRQYSLLPGQPASPNRERKDDLLTPFLLSIPVIVMLIILIYSL